MESEPPAVAVETCDDEKLDGEPLGPEDECGEGVEVRDDAAFTFGWDEEMMAAWRQPAGKKNDYCDEICIPEGAADGDDIVAGWSDGTTWHVPSVNVAEWRMMASSSSNITWKTLDVFWEGAHHSGDHV